MLNHNLTNSLEEDTFGVEYSHYMVLIPYHTPYTYDYEYFPSYAKLFACRTDAIQMQWNGDWYVKV